MAFSNRTFVVVVLVTRCRGNDESLAQQRTPLFEQVLNIHVTPALQFYKPKLTPLPPFPCLACRQYLNDLLSQPALRDDRRLREFLGLK
jgi:hypothetical protein